MEPATQLIAAPNAAAVASRKVLLTEETSVKRESPQPTATKEPTLRVPDTAIAELSVIPRRIGTIGIEAPARKETKELPAAARGDDVEASRPSSRTYRSSRSGCFVKMRAIFLALCGVTSACSAARTTAERIELGSLLATAVSTRVFAEVICSLS